MQDRASTIRSPHDLIDRVRGAWAPEAWRDVHVAVAVSGGADSVALIRALDAVKRESGGRGRLVVLHYDHRVRSEESATDARWVAQLAASVGLEAIVGHSDTSGPRSEQALRDERRDFFRGAVEDLGARYLATGHTADDQAETVLFRALRGSGLRGLAGIRPTATLTAACTLVRPLLTTTRTTIDAYLASIGQDHREDASNATDDYTRNWLRNEILPQLEERIPAAGANLAAVSSHAAEASDLIDSLAERLLGMAAKQEPAGWRFDASTLMTEPPELVTAAIRLAWRQSGWPEQAMTAAAWRKLTELATLAEPCRAETFPGGVRAESDREGLLLARSAEA